jgi:hypothetical protein
MAYCTHLSCHFYRRTGCWDTHGGQSWSLAVVRRLDDVFTEVVRPGETPYLKIDAQGYETRILKGGLSVLERFPLIQIETSFFPVYKDEPVIGGVIQFLATLGFRVISFEPGWDDPRTGEMLQADLIFART